MFERGIKWTKFLLDNQKQTSENNYESEILDTLLYGLQENIEILLKMTDAQEFIGREGIQKMISILIDLFMKCEGPKQHQRFDSLNFTNVMGLCFSLLAKINYKTIVQKEWSDAEKTSELIKYYINKNFYHFFENK
jgi:uncharacterized protein YlaN (UPF0358 family)